MKNLSGNQYVLARLRDDWRLLLSIFVGIAAATSLVAGAPVYLRSLEAQAISAAIDRSDSDTLNMFALAPYVPLTGAGLEDAGQAVDGAMASFEPSIVRGLVRHVRAPFYSVGLPGRPLPSPGQGNAPQGYLQSLDDVEQHVRFVAGRMATDSVSAGPRGPVVEAVIGELVAFSHGIEVGDTVALTPSLAEPKRVSATIVGIVEATDPSEEYWQGHAGIFIRPDPPDNPPIALFVTRVAILEAGRTFPGTLARVLWFVFVDGENLKRWSSSQISDRLLEIENRLAESISGASLTTGVDSLVDDFETRRFFTSVPLLLLMVVMVITVLYYLAMMVSYLVQSREADVALLRSRGIGTMQLLRLYAAEGAVLVLVGVVMAPFIAMGAVALAGKLPYFSDITGGDFLPVDFRWEPFAVAAGAGLLSLAIFVIPGVLGARTGLVMHKLRSSRPPSVPIFQRYYVDIAVLGLGGLIFWELHERGHVVSGGLFSGAQVNDVLLFAPVLFLIGIALLFMRLFPLFVRFVSGESAALVHLATAATLVTLAPAVVYMDVRDDNGFAWLTPVVLLAAMAGAYWATHRAQRMVPRVAWLAVQGGAIALFGFVEPPVVAEFSFVPSIALFCLVPAQLLFYLFKALTRAAPAWISMGIWHMARDPLQYSWLVLLLVMATGLGIMSTTVGGTLNLSFQQRISYEVGSDIRVTGVPWVFSKEEMRDRYAAIPGVTAASPAFRGTGKVGTTFSGVAFDILGIESPIFPGFSWYRDDFSELSLAGVMRALQPNTGADPVDIPDGATAIGVWTKPLGYYPGIYVAMAIQGADGDMETVSLGPLGAPDWNLMRIPIPAKLAPPLQLVSVQVSEAGFASATPGSILLDDIHVSFDGEGREMVLDDFEGRMRWSPLATSKISTDTIAPTSDQAYRGERSALFSFGEETNGGVRGFYNGLTGTSLPVVVSSSFASATGAGVGDRLAVAVGDRLVPIVVRDTVDYFPTLDPNERGFVLADLDHLLWHLNLVSPTSTMAPNEVFVKAEPGAGQRIRESPVNLDTGLDILHGDLVRDRASMLSTVRNDPLVSAGWETVVLLSVAVIVLTAGLGYVTYLLAFARRSRIEMGTLRSIGLSVSQVVGLLGTEHLIVAFMGVGLGTWAGFQMSTLMVSSVSVTENGAQIVPPFELTTDWSFMLPVYGAMFAIFIVSLLRLALSLRTMDLQSVSRMEG